MFFFGREHLLTFMDLFPPSKEVSLPITKKLLTAEVEKQERTICRKELFLLMQYCSREIYCSCEPRPEQIESDVSAELAKKLDKTYIRTCFNKNHVYNKNILLTKIFVISGFF